MHETDGLPLIFVYLSLPIYTIGIWLIGFLSARLTSPRTTRRARDEESDVNRNGNGNRGSSYNRTRRHSWECEDGYRISDVGGSPSELVYRSELDDASSGSIYTCGGSSPPRLRPSAHQVRCTSVGFCSSTYTSIRC